MPEYENLMIELMRQFKQDILSIEESRNAHLYKQAGSDLKNIYALHLKSSKNFAAVDLYLKNLYSTFNYSAAVITQALNKKSALTPQQVEKLDEGLELMIRCCDVIISTLKK